MLNYYLKFFFSSRRRHTRCLSDWSSDVCSSDLPTETSRILWGSTGDKGGVYLSRDGGKDWERSEERRVGKECRVGWLGVQYKRKRGRVCGVNGKMNA